MMKCIESAVDQGHISPDEGRELGDQIQKLLKEGLAPHEARQRMIDDADMAMKLQNRRARLQEVRRVVLTDAVLKHVNKWGENDPAEALWLLMEHHGQGQFPDLEHRRQVILAQAHATMRPVLEAFHKGFWTGDFRRNRPWVAARLDNMVREAFGQDTGDVAAKALAKAWIETAELLRQRYNEAGGNVRELDRWGLSQTHDREIIKKSKSEWVDYLMRPGVLDRDRMVSPHGHKYNDAELRDAIEHVWETITSDSWIDREPGYASPGKGALAKQKDEHHRWLHFKDADQWLAYNKHYGNGDAFQTMTQHMGRMARDIATMEVLGPAPEQMRNYLKQLVLKYAAAVPPVQRTIGEMTGKLETRLVPVIGEEAAGHWTGRLMQALRTLSEADRNLKALEHGMDPAPLARTRADAEKAVHALVKALDDLEPVSIGQRRADLTGEVAMMQAEIERVRNKSAPQLGGKLSRRGKATLRELQGRLAEFERQIADLDGADNTIAGIDPKLQRELVAGVMRLRDEALRQDLTQNVIAGFRPVKNPMDSAERAIYRHDKMWDVIRGTHFTPVSTNWANGLQSFRNVMTASLLGSAALTAFVTDPLYQRTARRLAGLPHSYVSILAGAIDGLRGATQAEAIEAGLMLDSALHLINRQEAYLETTGFRRGKGFGKNAVDISSFLAERTIELSGLSKWTQAIKHAFGLQFQRTAAKLADQRFDALPLAMQQQMKRYGIDAVDWDTIRSAEQHDASKGTALETALAPLIGGYKLLRPKEIARIDPDVAEKWLTMMLAETRRAVPEGTVRGRILFGGERPGTFVGDLSKNVSQFKSFPVTVVTLQLGMITEMWAGGQKARAVGTGAEYLIFAAVLGAVANELFEIVNGRDPVLPRLLAEGKMPDSKYWSRALLKAGGLGILGDYVAAPVNRFGGGLLSTVAGPVPGEIEKLRNRSFGSVFDWYEDKPVNAGRKVTDTLRELTPGRTIWWARLPLERLVLNKLQEMIDPDAEEMWRRHRRMQKKTLGNDYWWQQGETLPGRGPALDGKVP
jgi:hypothetical protein